MKTWIWVAVAIANGCLGYYLGTQKHAVKVIPLGDGSVLKTDVATGQSYVLRGNQWVYVR